MKGRNDIKGRKFGSAQNMSSALDFMAEALGGATTHESTQHTQHTHEQPTQHTHEQPTQHTHESTQHTHEPTPDFPIADPELKRDYTAAFLEVYGTSPIPPIVRYNEITRSLKYSSLQQIYTPAYHIGQRKLILNEIQFLTKIKGPALVVYAGAAPSNKGAMLASLFPQLKFLLIDPANFDIRPYRGVKIHHLDVTNDTSPIDVIDAAKKAFETADVVTAQVYMSGGIAEELGMNFGEKSFRKDNVPAMYFMSDIRTNMVAEGPTTIDLLWNSAQHLQWVHLMHPRSTMLKFRIPFFNESDGELLKYEEMSHQKPYADAFDFTSSTLGVDMRTFVQRKFSFFAGEIFLQPWAPISSTETRLVFNGVPDVREYHLHEYENKFFYYNQILRAYQLYQNPNANRKLGFDHCIDCALENVIWADYCASRGLGDDHVLEYVKALSKITYRPLLHGNHGRAFGPIPLSLLEKRFAEYNKRGGDDMSDLM
jgi:hypothetical protein